MSEFTASDHAHMARALKLAERGRYGAHPNPMVGCVLVNDGRTVGEGWHERAGGPHAEVNALAAARGEARGATAYVSLEPCTFHGKTPPCTDALIETGVSRVVAAMRDPHPRVSGDGLNLLHGAGIDVDVGLLDTQAEDLNRGVVRLKIATSLDGCVAMATGQSQWITGTAARSDVQRLRAASGAILSGIGTVLSDDPAFTVRDEGLVEGGRQPLRVILDSELRMPQSAGMLALPGETLIFCTDDAARGPLEASGAEILRTRAVDGGVDLEHVLATLGDREINDVLVEAGPGVGGALVDAGLVDELVIYQAPHIMGSETAPMLKTPGWQQLTDRRELTIVERRVIGEDLRITAKLNS